MTAFDSSLTTSVMWRSTSDYFLSNSLTDSAWDWGSLEFNRSLTTLVSEREDALRLPLRLVMAGFTGDANDFEFYEDK